MNEGQLIVISGPSGVGKGTILKRLKKELDVPHVTSISWTTRKKRSHEIHGKDYFFVSKREFEKNIKLNMFLEYAEYNGHLYGTPKLFVKEMMSKGKIVFLEIDVKGALTLINKRIHNMTTFFIAPPSIKDLKIRLEKRGENTLDDIKKRLEVAMKELKQKNKYDYIIVNDSLDLAVQKILGKLKKT